MALLVLGLAAASTHASPWQGEVSAQARWFVQPAADPRQTNGDLSLAGKLQFSEEFDQRRQRFAFSIAGRIDSQDGERSQFDIGELNWRYRWSNAELTIGLDKVFWGVTEALHLVDIVNQTNRVDSPDGESKLGQPMIRLAFNRQWGELEFFVLPGFREQRLPGSAGRLRGPLQLIADEARYETNREQGHVDLAFRYQHFIGNIEFAISHFAGLERTPLLQLDRVGATPVLTPFYFLTDQTGLELTMVTGSWLWKLESVSKRDDQQRYFAATGGFEWTASNVFGTGADIGIIAEYQYDGRDASRLLQSVAIADDDIVLGARVSVNDFANTEWLLLHGFDRNSRGRVTSVEGSRRLGQRWRLSLEARFFSSQSPMDVLSIFDNEDYWQLELTRYF